MTFEEFKIKFQIHLTQQQLAAVTSIEHPTLLLAVPGSGKTTVLVTRLGYMVYCCGIKPEHILTVTYTVAATRDMRQRCVDLFGEELANRLEFRTINGICAKIISYYGNYLGKKAYDLVTDEKYRTKLLSAIYVDLQKSYPTESDLKSLSMLITYIKNRMLTKSEIEALGEEQEFSLLDIYNAYCSEMRRQSKMDFDDQMVYALMMLRKSPQLLAHFQERYPYICVDEAQDTSKIQHAIIGILAEKEKHLFMVGDEDQSIYGFRAAYPEALLDFEKNYKNAKVLLMEENFRSNGEIVAAADQFIQKNEFRHSKRMRAYREPGSQIQKIEMSTRRGQYTYLEKAAEDCGTQTAVLYRDNESILPLVDRLERKGIPYQIKNADLTFFSHRIIFDIRNIILFAENPADTELFLQIYYKIGTYMNKMVAMEACRISGEKGIPIMDAALEIKGLPSRMQKSIRIIQAQLQAMRRDTGDKAVYRITYNMGYGDYLNRSQIKDGKIQILSAIGMNEPSGLRLVERLEELSMLIREKKMQPECRFLLSTIHSSKGLEYDRVYLMDVRNGIFPETVLTNPKKASIEEKKAYEEERRLFYVGVTRAKNNLSIFYFKNEATFTEELLGVKQDSRIAGRKEVRAKKQPFAQISSLQETAKIRKITESEYMDKLEEIRTTGYVMHRTYGEGCIRSIHGDTLEIEFDSRTAKCKLKFMMEHELLE